MPDQRRIKAPVRDGPPPHPETQEVFYRLFEFVPDAIVVVDQQGVIRRANAKTEQMFGHHREELIGQPVEVLIPQRFARRHVEYRERYLDEPRTRPMGASQELFARRKDGSEFPVDIMLSPLDTSEGKVVLAVVRDITERKKIEAQAKESQEMFFRLFEFAPDAIVVVDQQGIIRRANAKTEQMFGYRREELVGQPVEVLIPDRFTERHVGYRSKYLHEPRTRPMGAGLELFGRRKDGSEFPVDIMLSPVEAERGRLVLGVVRDITERKQAEAQARERREMLLKEVHHRVKNNLQVISSLLYLQSTYVADRGTLEILTESQNRVKSIALIHEKLYRSEDLEKLDFGEYVRDLLADLIRTYRVQQDSIAVHTRIEGARLGIDTAIPCGLIINELVSNAFKHAFPPGGTGEVWIDLHPAQDRRYVLSVRDSGAGLPKDFDWRRSKSLGLKLVTDLTKQLEGEVQVCSDAGTTFTITFAELQYKERG